MLEQQLTFTITSHVRLSLLRREELARFPSLLDRLQDLVRTERSSDQHLLRWQVYLDVVNPCALYNKFMTLGVQ